MERDEITKKVERYMAAVRKAIKESGRSRPVDVISLDILKTNLTMWLMAVENVNDIGILLDSDRGNKSKNPAIDVANASLRQVLAIMQDYGLTAISKKKLEKGEMKADDEDNPLIDFFKSEA